VNLARHSSVILLAAALLGGCKGRGLAKVERILLAQADSATVPAPTDGALLLVGSTDIELIPTEPKIRLALSWDKAWKDVNKLITRLETSQREVVLLVGKDEEVGAFALENPTNAKGRKIRLNDNASGKACVTVPGVKEGKCVQSYDKKYIDRAGVREIVREAVKATGIEAVEVEVWPDLVWGDVVRLIDGARTCCADRQISVQLSAASRRLQ
jgi:hypothetical protein